MRSHSTGACGFESTASYHAVQFWEPDRESWYNVKDDLAAADVVTVGAGQAVLNIDGLLGTQVTISCSTSSTTSVVCDLSTTTTAGGGTSTTTTSAGGISSTTTSGGGASTTTTSGSDNATSTAPATTTVPPGTTTSIASSTTILPASTTTIPPETTTVPATTTIIVPSTTTTAPGTCPAGRVLGEGSPQLESLRALRDGTLARSGVGRKLISLYYRNAGSIDAALERSPALRGAARRLLEAVASLVK